MGRNVDSNLQGFDTPVTDVTSSKIVSPPIPNKPFPENTSLPALLRIYVTESNAHKVFQECAETGVTYTRASCLEQAKRLRNALLSPKLQLRDESHVAILLPNIPEFFSIFVGVIDAGMSAVMLNPAYPDAEMERLMLTSGVDAVITLPEKYRCIKPLLDKLQIKTAITVGANDQEAHNYFDLIKSDSSDDSLEPVTSLQSGNFDSNKTAIVFFSSGTTGPPKAAQITHRNMVSYLSVITELLGGKHGDESMYTIFSWFHAAGMSSLLVAFCMEFKNIAYPVKFTVPNFVNLMKKFKPTVLWLPPTVISIICSSNDLQVNDLKHISVISYMGSPLGRTLYEKLREKLDSSTVTQQLYGSSELAGAVLVQPLAGNNQYQDSIGKLTTNLELKVRCTSTGIGLAANEKGEILFRGPMVFKGYINNAAATQDAIDEEGWYCTGDFGYYDEEGSVYITGRIKDIIKVHSFQVSPEEIENVIRQHELVEQVVVFGIPDEKSQEAPRALIVRKSESLTEAQIHEFLQDKLVKYKQLRGGIRFVDSLPLSPGLPKIQRAAAKQMDLEMSQASLTKSKEFKPDENLIEAVPGL